MDMQLSTDVNVQQQTEVNDVILEIAEKLDFLDIQILRRFYSTGKQFPYDTQPYCFPVLFKEMRSTKQLKIGLEALRKRLEGLIKIGLLEKVRFSNPTTYSPINEKSSVVQAIITRFLLINGLSQFL